MRLSWTRLLKHVFALELEHCPHCGGELKIIAAILEQPVIEKIPTHLGLQARAPAREQALRAAWAHSTTVDRAAWCHGLRGSAASGVFRTGAKRPHREGEHINDPSDGGPERPDSPVFDGPPSTAKTVIRASADGPGYPMGTARGSLNELSSLLELGGDQDLRAVVQVHGQAF